MQNIFSELLKVASTEGLKIVRLRAIASLIRVVQGLRRLILLQYFIMITCFLCAFSLFFGLYLLANQMSLHEPLCLNWPLGFCCVLFVITLSALVLSLRERTWIQAFRLDELMDAAIASEESGPAPALSAEDVARIVEEVMDRKFEDFLKKAKKNPKSN